MELQVHFQCYVKQLSEELGISPIPQMRVLCSPVSSGKHCSGDFSVYMSQPSAKPLKPHIHRLISDLPRVSKLWPLQISEVQSKAECPYLELNLTRPTAFQYLCQIIDEVHSSIPVCDSTVGGRKRLLLLEAPEQNEFDCKKSTLLMTYMRRLCQFSGFECTLLEGNERLTRGCQIDKEELKGNPYYDESLECFDLPKFIKDRQLTDKFDPSIGVLFDSSPALKHALALRRYLSATPETIVCHVVPQNKSLVQQQIGLLLMIFGCRANQNFVIHGGIDGGGSSMEDLEQRIGIYISDQLRQKQVPGTAHVGEVLKETKLVFDFLGIKQQNRLKNLTILQDSDSNSFEGKGGLFVQYTCSRLMGLLRRYDQAIIHGVPSDELREENMDWALLSSDQEWNLWKTMIRFLDLLRSLKKVIPEKDSVLRIDVKANSVCEGLLNLCKEFSVFYSKVRILVEGQTHLFPTIECRIYFVRMLLKLIKCGLWLLGLQPVECM